MARQRRPRRHRTDPIRDLQEWQNHQYDPGYLANLSRLRLFSGGRRSAARYLLAGLAAILASILVLPVLVSAGIAVPLAALIVGIALLIILVVTLMRARRAQERRSRHGTGRRR
jgi:Flp pilus assembly protein TadB